VGIIWILIFYWYPIYLKHVFNYHNPVSDLSHESEGFGRGTFGDMYGPLNTFVSGLASLGAIVAILVQISLFKIDKDILKKEKEEISILLIQYFKSNLNNLNSKNIKPLRERFNKIITSRFSMRETYIDSELGSSTDYYFKAILSISRDEIFRAYHISKNPKADSIIELYHKIELLYKVYTELTNLLQNTRQALVEMESKAYFLKTEILLRDRNEGNRYGFLLSQDLFSNNTLTLLERQNNGQEPNTFVTSLIGTLEHYYWKK
jgi:hypothetical protein